MKRRGKKMKKFIKYGSIVVISLAILISCNVNSYDCDVFAEEKNEEQNTETDIICNWPEDIIDPGPALPQYLSAPKIMNILNTNKGIKVQWKKVNNARIIYFLPLNFNSFVRIQYIHDFWSRKILG